MQPTDWYATHYFRADRPPFLSLSEVDTADVEQILGSLGRGSRRRFGPRYLDLRRATEAAARAAFIGLGGQPQRMHPHYFVLGESPWFAGLYDQPRAVRIPLDDLPPELTSFTWTDSITALGLGTDLGVPQPRDDEDQHLHRLDQLDLTRAGARADARVSAAEAAGDESYAGYETRLLDQYVELQLWGDGPVEPYR